MNKNDLTKYIDYLFKAALYKTNSIPEAEDLAQDTLLAALVHLDGGKDIENPKSWLLTVLNRRFNDSLRRKYRKPTVSMDIIIDLPYEADISEEIEKSDDTNKIRRCVSMLTEKYREVIVRYYMKGQSVKKIAADLGIPENTVKTRLSTGRKYMGKEFEVNNNIKKQSYEPENLWIGCSGKPGLNNEPDSIVGKDKIKMNLLLLAYEKPLEITELANAIGIPTAYVEPIVGELLEGGLMQRVSNKVFTDFVIYDEKDRYNNTEDQLGFAEENYKAIWETVEKGLNELRNEEYYQRQRRSAQLKLESFFAVNTLSQMTRQITNLISGTDETKQYDYPRRPNGGEWIALGNRYPLDYDYSKQPYREYGMNGIWGNGIFDYLDLHFLSLDDFDCELGRPFSLYDAIGKDDVVKMLYAVYTDNKDAFSCIDKLCIDKIDDFTALHYLSKDKDGALVCEVPVITNKERCAHFDMCVRYAAELAEKFRDKMKTLYKNPVKIPEHVRSFAEWEKYNYCVFAVPMAVILKAKEAGIFLKGEETPVPAVYMVIEKEHNWSKMTMKGSKLKFE